MIGELDELRERIASLPEEEQNAALFALGAIENEMNDRAAEMNVDETASSSPVV